jgi:hypothetical protein
VNAADPVTVALWIDSEVQIVPAGGKLVYGRSAVSDFQAADTGASSIWSGDVGDNTRLTPVNDAALAVQPFMPAVNATRAPDAPITSTTTLA